MSRYRARARKRDDNEQEIVSALQAIGATVERLDVVDLLVGYRGANYLLEVKNPETRRGQQGKTGSATAQRQEKWRSKWLGQVSVVESVEEALFVLGTSQRIRGPG